MHGEPITSGAARLYAQRTNTVWFFTERGLIEQSWLPGGMTLPQVMNSNGWFATPHGLVAPLYALNWAWHLPRGPMIGTATQADRFARRCKIDPNRIEAAHLDDIHGSCVLDGDPEGGDWRLVQCGTFPAWAGV